MKTTDKIAQIVAAISPILEFSKVETVGDNCRYYTCDTSYALVGREIDFGPGPVLILGVEPNTYIEVLNPGVCEFFTQGTLNYELHFFHGTVINVNNELTGIPDSDNKVPMVYLLEPFIDEINNDEDSIIQRTTNCHLFFLSWSNYWDWQTNEHHEFVLDPMETLAENFMSTAKKIGLVWEIAKYTQTSRVNFGVYKSSGDNNSSNTTGAEKRRFNDQLSGIEIKVTLPFLGAQNCC